MPFLGLSSPTEVFEAHALLGAAYQHGTKHVVLSLCYRSFLADFWGIKLSSRNAPMSLASASSAVPPIV
jgi:hypothetical protein